MVDRENHRIQVFTAEGKFLNMFGRHGKGTGEFDSPVDIAIDTSDTLYVCENLNHRVSVFTSEGVFITSFGSYGIRPGKFVEPYGIAVNSDGFVYVSDNRVQLF